MTKPHKDDFDDEKLKNYIEQNFPFVEDAYIPLGFSSAFIGVAAYERDRPTLVFDSRKIIDLLMKRDEMSFEDAVEFFEYNIEGFKTSENTHPLFIHFVPSQEWQKTD